MLDNVPRVNFSRLNSAQRVSAVAIAVVILGAFLPWYSIFGISKIGVEGDGVLTLILAVVGGAVLLVTGGVIGDRTAGKKSRILLIVLAALVALVALVDMNGVTAIGLYLTLFAGIAWLVGAIWDINVAKAQRPSEGAPGGQSETPT